MLSCNKINTRACLNYIFTYCIHNKYFKLQNNTKYGSMHCNMCMSKQTYRHTTIHTHQTSCIRNQTKNIESNTPAPLSYKAYNTRQKKQTALNNYKYTIHIKTQKCHSCTHQTKNIKFIHTTTVTTYMSIRNINRLIQATAPLINISETSLTSHHASTQNK